MTPDQMITVSFDQPGALGIEFVDLSAPYKVERVHEMNKVAHDNIQEGDVLIFVNGQNIEDQAWDSFKPMLVERPVQLQFFRPPAKTSSFPRPQQTPGSALGALGGFGSSLKAFGASATSAVDAVRKSAGTSENTKNVEPVPEKKSGFGGMFSMAKNLGTGLVGDLKNAMADDNFEEETNAQKALVNEADDPFRDDDAAAVSSDKKSQSSIPPSFLPPAGALPPTPTNQSSGSIPASLLPPPGAIPTAGGGSAPLVPAGIPMPPSGAGSPSAVRLPTSQSSEDDKEWEKVEGKVAELNVMLMDERGKVQELQEKIKQEQVTYNEKDQELATLRNEIVTLKESVTSLSSGHNEASVERDRTIAHLQQEISDLRAAAGDKSVLVTELEQQRQIAEDAQKNMEIQIKALQAFEAQKAELENHFAAEKHALQTEIEQLSVHAAQAPTLADKNASLESELEHLKEVIAADNAIFNAERTALKDQVDNLREASEEASQVLEQNRILENEVQELKATSQKEIEHLEKKSRDSKAILDHKADMEMEMQQLKMEIAASAHLQTEKEALERELETIKAQGIITANVEHEELKKEVEELRSMAAFDDSFSEEKGSLEKKILELEETIANHGAIHEELEQHKQIVTNLEKSKQEHAERADVHQNKSALHEEIILELRTEIEHLQSGNIDNEQLLKDLERHKQMVQKAQEDLTEQRTTIAYLEESKTTLEASLQESIQQTTNDRDVLIQEMEGFKNDAASHQTSHQEHIEERENLQKEIDVLKLNASESQRICEAIELKNAALGDEFLEEHRVLEEEIKLLKSVESNSNEVIQELEQQKNLVTQYCQERDELQKEIGLLKEATTDSSTQLVEELEHQKKVANDFNTEREALQEEIAALHVSVTESIALAQEFEQQKQVINKYTEEKATLEKEIEMLKTSSSDSSTALIQELEQQKQIVTDYTEERTTLQQELETLKSAAAESSSMSQEVEQCKQIIADLEKFKEEHTQKMADNDADLSTLQSENLRLAEQISQETANAQITQQKLDEQAGSLTALEEYKSNQESLLATKAEELRVAQETTQKLEEALKQAEEEPVTLGDAERQRFKLKIAQLEAQLKDKKGSEGEDEDSEPPPPAKPAEYDVTFALAGPLGIQFNDNAKDPYTVQKIHPNCVASDLNIDVGDILIRLNNEPVPRAWNDFVAKVSKRPVVATFFRAQEEEEHHEAEQKKGLFGGFKLKTPVIGGHKNSEEMQELSKKCEDLKQERDNALAMLRSTEKVLDTMGADGPEGLVTKALEESKRLEMLEQEKKQAERLHMDELQRQNDKYGSLLQQFDALQDTAAALKNEAGRNSKLAIDLQKAEEVNTQLKDKLAEKKSHQKESRSHASDDSAVSKDFKRRNEDLEKQLRSTHAKLEEAQQAYHDQHSQIEQLENMIETLEADVHNTDGASGAELLGALSDNRQLQRKVDELEKEKASTTKLRRERDERYSEMEMNFNMSRNHLEKMASEVDRMKAELVNAQEVSHQAIYKLRKDMEDRPFLVDKRMCVQMLVAYLNAPKSSNIEILQRMADSLGFTKEERQQLGLERGVFGSGEEGGRSGSQLATGFMDFLESELQ